MSHPHGRNGNFFFFFFLFFLSHFFLKTNRKSLEKFLSCPSYKFYRSNRLNRKCTQTNISIPDASNVQEVIQQVWEWMVRKNYSGGIFSTIFQFLSFLLFFLPFLLFSFSLFSFGFDFFPPQISLFLFLLFSLSLSFCFLFL